MLTRRLQMRCGVCLLVAERIDVGIVRRYLHALIRMAGAAQAHLCSGRAEMPTHHSGSSSVPGLRALGDVLAEGWDRSIVHPPSGATGNTHARATRRCHRKSEDWLLTGKAHVDPKKRVAKIRQDLVRHHS